MKISMPNSIAGPSRRHLLVNPVRRRTPLVAPSSVHVASTSRPATNTAPSRGHLMTRCYLSRSALSSQPEPSDRLSRPSTSPSSTGSPVCGGSFSTINASEISHFSRLASEWWSETGEFALLHRMNPPRIEYIRQLVAFDPRVEPEWIFADRHTDREREEKKGTGRWFAGKRVLDVGCGGGLLSEALARLGGEVVGVDASGVNIGMARMHAAQDPGLPFVLPPELEDSAMELGGKGKGKGMVGSLEYRHTSAEALRDAGEKFDVVCAMEVVEHVDEPGEFMKALGDMVKPGGYLIMSTISRTPLSRLLTLTLAEDVLRLVSPGTHTYEKFIKPEELRRFVYSDMGGYDIWEQEQDAADIKVDEVGRTRGIVYDPTGGRWRLWDGAEGTWRKGLGEGCNYMFGARKRFDAPK